MLAYDFLLNLVVPATPAQREIVSITEVGSGIFAFALFLLSLYSWYRRGHYTLILFSAAFLVFFINIMLDVFEPFAGGISEVIGALLNFLTLALFFLALVIGSGRKKLFAQD